VGGGYLDADAALASVPSLPGAPSPPTTINGDSEVSVNWSTGSTDPNFPITGYTVTPYLSGVMQTPVAVDASTFSHLFSGLTNGASYTFTVTASNANGAGRESAPSAVVAIGVPGPPTGVTADSGVNQAQVHWSAPGPDGLTITGYTVATLVGGVTQTTQTFPTATTSQTITGLTNNTTYTFRVAAIDAFATGPYSAPSSPITVGVPDPPTGVSAQPGCCNNMSLRWVAPSDNGAPITQLVVTPYLNGVTALAPTTVSANIVVVVAATSIGSPYTFTIAAKNSRGVGAPSAPSAPVIQGSPGSPEAPTSTPGDGSARVTWLEPPGNGSAEVAYTVNAYVGATQVASHSYPATSMSQIFTGLTNGTTYRFTVAGQNDRGLGPASPLGNATTVGSPAAPTASAVPGSTRATVNWTAPVANGSAITSYVVTPYLAGMAQTPRTFLATARTATFTGLTNGSTYTFKVSAKNVRGTGPQSIGADVAVGSPIAPTAPTAKPGNGKAIVKWTAPTVNNGAGITGYVITQYRNGVVDFSWTFASTATTQTITLNNGLSYTFRISARNSRGEGPKSAATPVITVGAPTAPTAVTATPLHTAATVHWTAPANNGALISGYTVIPYIGTVAQTPRPFNASTLTRTIYGLTTGKQYTFKVKATNVRGTGPLSLASNAVTVT
jgi:hypothetical protein